MGEIFSAIMHYRVPCQRHEQQKSGEQVFGPAFLILFGLAKTNRILLRHLD